MKQNLQIQTESTGLFSELLEGADDLVDQLREGGEKSFIGVAVDPNGQFQDHRDAVAAPDKADTTNAESVAEVGEKTFTELAAAFARKLKEFLTKYALYSRDFTVFTVWCSQR